MPRQPDLEVEGHVLDAAYRLWRSKGEHGLTMRAVAREAETTTPTVYQRFQDKREILEALRLRAQQQLFATVKGRERSHSSAGGIWTLQRVSARV